MKKTILFTGGSGLLAINWAVEIARDFDVVLVLHKRNISVPGVRTITFDLDDASALLSTLKTIQPDCVIHCAGLTSVEACEAQPELAYHVNVELSVNTAIVCKQLGIQYVYISTDHLFSGNKPLVTEDDSPGPVNQYGKTKLEAEKRVLDISETFLAIRTNFYGWGPVYRRSFSDMIIDNLGNGKPVTLFEDFFYTPILIEELSQTVMALLEKKAQGVFHVVGDERISKLEFGMRVATRFGFDKKLIQVARFSDRKDLVRRPHDLSLSNKKVSAFLGKNIGDVNANIEQLYAQKENGILKEIQSI